MHPTRRQLPWLAAAAVAAGPLPAGDPPARFTAAARKPADAVTVTADGTRAAFDVTSPSGIGSAIVTRTGDGWPPAVTVRLRLSGLEHFTASTGTTAVGAAVGLRDGKLVTRAWASGRDDKDLPAGDPLRPTVRVLDAAGRPATAVPVKDGMIEVALPPKLFADNPAALTVDWIDFHR